MRAFPEFSAHFPCATALDSSFLSLLHLQHPPGPPPTLPHFSFALSIAQTASKIFSPVSLFILSLYLLVFYFISLPPSIFLCLLPPSLSCLPLCQVLSKLSQLIMYFFRSNLLLTPSLSLSLCLSFLIFLFFFQQPLTPPFFLLSFPFPSNFNLNHWALAALAKYTFWMEILASMTLHSPWWSPLAGHLILSEWF